MNLQNASHEVLESRQMELQQQYEDIREAKLSLDLTRGKPAADQLDLSNDLDGILDGFYLLQDGTDVRNYGAILGIPEARTLGAELLDLNSANVLVGGNSSLSMMYHYVTHMLPNWREETEVVKFLCPVPGYDRHFTVCEQLGINMINVKFTADGPDMNEIYRLVENDAAIKGIWCVPKYSNPTGHTYSTETVKRFAQLGKVAGANFRIMWDNAYVVHHVNDSPDQLANLMDSAEREGTADNIVMFTSTSKVTFAGAGISFFGASESNLKAFEDYLSAQIIGFDKVNQLRHVRFLKDLGDVKAHMGKHQQIIKPKFELVNDKLENALGDKGIATWTRPNGGYFVSLDTTYGIADKVVTLAADLGVKLTPAGATFPYGKDPDNSNIRIAPTFPGIQELSQTLDVLVLCLELATIQHLLSA